MKKGLKAHTRNIVNGRIKMRLARSIVLIILLLSVFSAGCGQGGDDSREKM